MFGNVRSCSLVLFVCLLIPRFARPVATVGVVPGSGPVASQSIGHSEVGPTEGDGQRLTRKNVVAMKVLLNLCHSMANVLSENGWAIVLDTLHHLYALLALSRAKRSASESTGSAESSPTPSTTGNPPQSHPNPTTSSSAPPATGTSTATHPNPNPNPNLNLSPAAKLDVRRH